MPENNVPLSEQAHWKKHNAQAPHKPSGIGEIGRGLLAIVVVGLGFGGWYGVDKYKEYMNGSKEMNLLEYHYWGESTPSSAADVTLEVPSQEAGGDGSDSRIIHIPVSKLSVRMRTDGKNITTVLFTKRKEYSPSYDVYWEQALILVPKADYDAWTKELERIRWICVMNCDYQSGQLLPRRIMPLGYKEPGTEERGSEDRFYFHATEH